MQRDATNTRKTVVKRRQAISGSRFVNKWVVGQWGEQHTKKRARNYDNLWIYPTYTVAGTTVVALVRVHRDAMKSTCERVPIRTDSVATVCPPDFNQLHYQQTTSLFAANELTAIFSFQIPKDRLLQMRTTVSL